MPSRDVQRRIDAYLDFRSGLREVLRNGDPQVFKLFLRDAGNDLGDPDLRAMGRWDEEALLPLMHRMILADRQLADRHAAARLWLRQHGLTVRVSPTGYGWSQELRRRYRIVEESAPGF